MYCSASSGSGFFSLEPRLAALGHIEHVQMRWVKSGVWDRWCNISLRKQVEECFRDQGTQLRRHRFILIKLLSRISTWLEAEDASTCAFPVGQTGRSHTSEIQR